MTLVALVDDHQLFSTALSLALRSHGLGVAQPGLSSLSDLLGELQRLAPDVVLVDRDLGPIGTGEELIGPLASAGTKVVVVSGSLDPLTVGRCLHLGAVTCIPKTEPFEQLLSTVLEVASGVAVLPEGRRIQLEHAWRDWKSQSDATLAPFGRLSGREAFVLGQLMEGCSVRDIAEASFVGETTIRSQVRAVLVKLGVNSQMEAVTLAFRIGWRPCPSDSLEHASST